MCIRDRAKKEAMKLSTPPEKAIQAKAWQREAKAEIAKSTGRGKEGWAWAREVEYSTFQELGVCSPDFYSADVRLLAACTKVCKYTNAATRIALETDKLDLIGEMLCGRQALWIIYDEFRTDASKDLLFGITHMIAIKCTDNDSIPAIRTYFNRWNYLLLGLKAPWNSDSPENQATKESLFLEQIQSSKLPLLTGALNAYRMAPKSDTATKSYDYLWRAVKFMLDKSLEDSNLVSLNSSLAKGPSGPAALHDEPRLSRKALAAQKKLIAAFSLASNNSPGLPASSVKDLKSLPCFAFAAGKCLRTAADGEGEE